MENKQLKEEDDIMWNAKFLLSLKQENRIILR